MRVPREDMERKFAAREHDVGKEVLHATFRGAVAAMSMTGMRAMTTRMGLLEETPPEMVVHEKAPALIDKMSKQQREGVIVLLHWAYGAGGGAAFGALPGWIRLKPWAGPVYGVLVWLGFEAALAPLLGLHMRRPRSMAERAALALDHVLYGAVLSELRRKPRR